MNRIVLLLSIGIAGIAAAESVGTEIRLREKIAPVGNLIRLGDIADVSDANSATARQLKLVPLWPAPPVGERRVVSDRDVRNVLVARGYEASQLQFRGSSRVTIGWAAPAPVRTTPVSNGNSTLAAQPTPQPASRSQASGFRAPNTYSSSATTRPRAATVSPQLQAAFVEQVKSAVVDYVQQQSGHTRTLDATVQLTSRQYSLLAEQTGDLTVSGGRSPWLGRQSIAVEIPTATGVKKLHVNAMVFDTTPVLMLTRPIARGDTITAADCALRTPDAKTRMPIGKKPVYLLEEAIGKEAGRALRVGDVLTVQDCLAPMVIERGEIATVSTGGGGIVIRRHVRATKDARIGELTEVELLDRRETLLARVVGPGELTILGSGPVSRSASKQLSPTAGTQRR